jgi:methyl-accepting chemotaxis protein
MREAAMRMIEVASIAGTASQTAEQTSAATQEQMASLGELTASSQQLTTAAAKLTETIQRFQLNGGSPAPEQPAVAPVPQQE